MAWPGVTGFHPEAGLASAKKIGVACPCLALPIDEIEAIVLDSELPDSAARLCRQRGITLRAG